MNKKLNLLQAVLASSCLVVPFSGQAFVVNTFPDTAQQTTADGATNTITATGSIHEITGPIPGVTALHKNNIITIESTGAQFAAILDSKDGGGISVAPAASNLTINNQLNRVISTDNTIFPFAGIATRAASTTINNDGTISSSGTGSAIVSSDASGTNLTINNNAAGKITSTIAGDGTIDTRADKTTINNSGDILSGSGSTILTGGFGATNLTINNTATGLISADVGSAIDVAVLGGSGLTISNAGTSNNNSAGIISNGTGPTVSVLGSIIKSFTNTGDIINTAVGGGPAIQLGGVTGPTFTNSGKIYNDSTVATILFLGGENITEGFVNTGDITNLGAGTAISYNVKTPSAVTFFQKAGTVTGNVSLNYNGAGTSLNMSGGKIDGDVTDLSAGGSTAIVSGGTITGDMSLTGGNQILNFSGGILGEYLSVNSGAATTLNLSGGTAKYVLLSGSGNHIVNLTGATLDGNLVALGSGGAELNLLGGTTNNVALFTGNHTVNLKGAAVQDIIGDANEQTINLSSGSYNKIDGGAGPNNVLNVLSSFNTTGTITNMPIVSVQAGVFNVNHDISEVKQFVVYLNSTMNVNSKITGPGSFISLGTTNIFSGSSVNMGGLVSNGGTLHIEPSTGITTPLTCDAFDNRFSLFTVTPGNLIVDLKAGQEGMPKIDAGVGLVTLKDSTITANPVGGTFMPTGTTWDIIANIPAAVLDQETVTVTTPSLLLNFAPVPHVAGAPYQIISSAVPLSSLPGGSEITDSLRNALDIIVNNAPTNPAMTGLLEQFQSFTSVQQIEQALRTLVPNFNHSISTMSSLSVRRAFDDIGIHLEELQAIRPLIQEVDKYRNNEDLDGWSYGDPLLRHESGAWIRPYGGFADQQGIEGIDGYKGDYTGITGGMDWHILDWATIGIAGSFAKTDITERGFIDIKQNIDSLQLTFYGQFDPYGPLYFNTLMGLARHKYGIDRTISVGTLVQHPQANYHGIQYAGQLEMGYAYFNGKYYVNPLASIKYMRLVSSNYTETGAPLGLTVDNNDVSEFIGAIGLRLSKQNEYLEATYIPEITGLISYDFIGDRQETFNNFAIGSPTFKSVGIKPDQTTYTLNIGLRIHTFHNSMFKVAYEFEAKDQYKSHSAMFKWYHKWY